MAFGLLKRNFSKAFVTLKFLHGMHESGVTYMFDSIVVPQKEL